MSDEIIREIWQIKDAIGKEVNYNLHSLGALLRTRQSTEGKQIVDLSSKRKATERNKSAKIAERKH
ncbi:MAG: hypothetical protein U9P37_03755 [Pseudomonadota bacterium]|nr:hypothetical protein [Pseudomonadota bacterium]